MGLCLSPNVEYYFIKCNLVIVYCPMVGARTVDLRGPAGIRCIGLHKATNSIKVKGLNGTHT